MKETLGIIPQVFYDLIGRVVPGAAILTLSFLLLADDVQPAAIGSSLIRLPTAVLSILFISSLLAAYLVGLLLGAIGFVWFEDGLKRTKFSEIRCGPPGDPVQETDIPYIYDFILMRAPAAGVRLVKLRAESHLCRVLVVGCFALAIAYLSTHWNVMTLEVGLVFAALLVSALAAFFFQRHLKVRTWRLSINCWIILTGATMSANPPPEPTAPSAPSAGPTKSSPANVAATTTAVQSLDQEK